MNFSPQTASFLPTLRKFCIMLHCQASQTEITKRNSTKLCQTVDSNISPYKSRGLPCRKTGSQKLYICSVFRRLRGLMANIFWTEHDMDNWARSLGMGSTKDLLRRLKISWTLVHKRFKLDRSFYPPSVNSAFCFVVRRCTQQTEQQFAKRDEVNGADVATYSSSAISGASPAAMLSHIAKYSRWHFPLCIMDGKHNTDCDLT